MYAYVYIYTYRYTHASLTRAELYRSVRVQMYKQTMSRPNAVFQKGSCAASEKCQSFTWTRKLNIPHLSPENLNSDARQLKMQ